MRATDRANLSRAWRWRYDRQHASHTHRDGRKDAIIAQVNSATLAAKRFVTLSQNYQRAPAPGYPDANAGVAVATSKTAFPQLILSGTILQSLAMKRTL